MMLNGSKPIALLISLFAASLLIAATGMESPLADASERADQTTVADLLAKGVAVDGSQPDGMTALHWAVYRDDEATVALLLRAGANVSVQNRYGVAPLSLAALNGSEKVLEALLEAGADPNTSRPGDETALMTASRTGKVRAVKALLAHGARVDATEIHGQTALMWAAAAGYSEVVELLIEFGADFRKRLETGFSPLLFAVREGHIDVVRSLLKAGADPNGYIDPLSDSRRPRPGTSALMLAVENAHYELGAVLLEAGADPNANRTGYTVLHMIPVTRNPGVGDNDPAPQGSGTMDSIEFVRLLAAHGADLNARMTTNTNLGNTRLQKMSATPFFVAAQSADANLLRVLAELGADPSLKNSENSTALMAATSIGTRSPGEDAGTEEEVLEAVHALLELGADINAVDDKGETAMHGAAYKNLPKVVTLLAEHGADVSVWNNKNAQGWTPLTIAYGYRFGNFKPSPPTIDAVERAMLAAGVLPPKDPKADGISDYVR